MQKRTAFFISDRTGKTAESIGQSLLSQFDGIEFEERSFSFVTTESDARFVADEIRKNAQQTGNEPLVFSTLVDDGLQNIIASTGACVISLFNSFIGPLEQSLQVKSSHTTGKVHEEFDDKDYKTRIDAIEFTLGHDDGIRTSQFDDADIILIGVSRSAKTPTCLYLAMHFSLKAANYPLTDDDLERNELPGFLKQHENKIVGLTINANRLSAIRQQRRPGTDYATLEKCQREIELAERLMNNSGILVIDSSLMSIEEIAVNIIKEKRLLRSKQS
ncbi:MAG: pyruvate, water dikinase regulatory protein [Gammaproteobacteria bacterium]|nr:pyruvate, water dikinase regulatory protein [Gammaproteobacteria bacterium]